MPIGGKYVGLCCWTLRTQWIRLRGGGDGTHLDLLIWVVVCHELVEFSRARRILVLDLRRGRVCVSIDLSID